MKSRAEQRKDIGGRSFDVCVIGGGATGAGCALDAQLRGLSAVMLDAGDFAGATSSGATKIIHGGSAIWRKRSRTWTPRNTT
jgi:glycerol-3-phosphate dehydrogenase